MLLIRHAESAWNVRFGRARLDAGMPDPPLTEHGLRQAEQVAETLAEQGVRRLMTSPYRRALQTASVIACRLGVPITGVEPLLRERCAFSCDQGSHPDLLRREWPELDFGALEPVWWGGVIESNQSLLRRCDRFRAALGPPGRLADVAAVTHWGFIRAMTGQEVGNVGIIRLD